MSDLVWHGRNLGELSDVEAAMYSAQLDEIDERGLMPVEEARRVLAGVSEFVRGREVLVNGRVVLDSDLLWAALLSLAGADEFVRVAIGLRWGAHIRGMDNLSAYDRYGDGILPWVRSRIGDDGVLRNVPWCVLPCLLESSSVEAFEIAASITGVNTWTEGDPPWVEQYVDAGETIRRWMARHSDEGFRELASAGPVSARVLRSLFGEDPRGTQRRLRAAVGKNRADAWLVEQGLQVPRLTKQMSEALRLAPEVKGWPRSRPVTMADLGLLFEDFQGPSWDNAAYLTSAMRLTGFVSPTASDGLVFQSLITGLGNADVRIAFHSVGFGYPPDSGDIADIVLVSEADMNDECLPDIGSINVRLPSGHSVKVGYRRGGQMTTPEAIVTALGSDRHLRDSVFLDSEALIDHVRLPQPVTGLFVLDEWEHPASGESPASSPDLQLAVEALRRRRAIDQSLTDATWPAYLRRRLQHLSQ